MPHRDVCTRFSLLCPGAVSPTEKAKASCERILRTALEPDEFTMGKTRAYFRLGVLEKLEEERIAHLGRRTIFLQRIVRGMLARRKYRRQRTAAVLLQKLQRRHAARVVYLQTRRCIMLVQCLQRARMAKQQLKTLREAHACARIQSCFRGHRARRSFLLQRAAVVCIQTVLRGRHQRQRYQAALAQAREDAKLENQLRRLQERLEEEQQRRKDMESRLRLQKEEEHKKQADLENRLRQQQDELRDAQAGAGAGAEARKDRPAEGNAIPAALLIKTEPPMTPKSDFAKEEEPKEQEAGRLTFSTAPLGKESSIDHTRDELYAESSLMLDTMRRELAKLRVENLDLKQQLEEIRFNARKAASSGDSSAAKAAATTHQLHDLRAANQRLAELAEERALELQSMKKQLASMRDQMLGAATMAEMAGEMHNENVRLAQLVSSQKEELHVKGAQYQDELFLRLHHEQTVAKMLKLLDKSIGDNSPDVVSDCYDIYEQAILGAAAERMSHSMELPPMKTERRGSIASRFIGWATGQLSTQNS
eukprot:scaffold1971_cov356-Pinguiococcus_pyrenoidosus.AAC.5